MDYNFENNTSKKKSTKKKSTNNYKAERRIKEDGFVARPGNKSLTSQVVADIEISAGRLNDGGYVAYPKEKPLSLHEKKSE